MADIPIGEDGKPESWAQTNERLKKERLRKNPPKEIPEHYFKDTDSPLDSDKPQEVKEPESQEERFRLAAIKLAMMEDEIIELTEKIPPEVFRTQKGVNWFKFSDGVWSLTSSTENIPGVDGKSAPVTFKKGITNYMRELGLNINNELVIYIHSDEDTREEFQNYAKTNPNQARGASTQYSFSENGEYRKISYIPRAIALDENRTVLNRAKYINVCLSEMTAGDFEIAGRALTMVKDRLNSIINPQKPAA